MACHRSSSWRERGAACSGWDSRTLFLRPRGAACTSTPGGELAQTLGEVCWLSLLRICAVLWEPPRMCVLIFAKVLSRSCCPSLMAPICIFRSANMTIEANVTRLSRRHGLAACFFPSCAPHNPQHWPIRRHSALAQLLLLV